MFTYFMNAFSYFSYLVEYMMTSFKQKLASFYFFVNHKKIAKIKSNLNTKFKFS